MPKTILLADDEPDTVVLVHERLQKAGYRVVTAFTGDEVLQKTQADLPDLILLDIVMPGMNGYRVCRRLKEDNATKHIPVILFTALQKNDLLVTAQASGADMIMSKPFEAEELLQVVQKFLKE